MEKKNNSKLWLLPFGVLLFASSVFAAVLIVFFGSGVINLVPYHDGHAGEADSSEFYYAVGTGSGWSKNTNNIVAFEDFNMSGALNFVVNDTNGSCSWFGLIKDVAPTESDTHISLNDLDGQAVTSAEYLYFAVKPTGGAVTKCSLDYNVSINPT